MRTWTWMALLAAGLFAGCGTQRDTSLTPERAALVEKEVREFCGTVAQDVTEQGPAAWRRHFLDSPAFYMVAEGRLVFTNSAAATTGILELTHTIKHIELKWGDLRVDPLTEQFAAVAAPYHEVMEDEAGKRMNGEGYFTATAEKRDGRWQFRNADWSAAGPASTNASKIE